MKILNHYSRFHLPEKNTHDDIESSVDNDSEQDSQQHDREIPTPEVNESNTVEFIEIVRRNPDLKSMASTVPIQRNEDTTGLVRDPSLRTESNALFPPHNKLCKISTHG